MATKLDDHAGCPPTSLPLPIFYPFPHSQYLPFVDCINQAPCPHAPSWVWPIEDPAGDKRVILECIRVLYP